MLYTCVCVTSHSSFCRYGSQLSEFFLLEYASSLASHTSLWQVAMGYLSECPQQGRAYMEAYIERVPVDSERKVVKVLRVCEKYQLKEKGGWSFFKASLREGGGLSL